jgi:hypothetical protein
MKFSRIRYTQRCPKIIGHLVDVLHPWRLLPWWRCGRGGAEEPSIFGEGKRWDE